MRVQANQCRSAHLHKREIYFWDCGVQPQLADCPHLWSSRIRTHEASGNKRLRLVSGVKRHTDRQTFLRCSSGVPWGQTPWLISWSKISNLMTKSWKTKQTSGLAGEHCSHSPTATKLQLLFYGRLAVGLGAVQFYFNIFFSWLATRCILIFFQKCIFGFPLISQGKTLKKQKKSSQSKTHKCQILFCTHIKLHKTSTFLLLIYEKLKSERKWRLVFCKNWYTA